MDAAEQLYAEYGFAQVSFSRITAAAKQKNKSALQYHFAGRDDLILAILHRHLDAVEERRLAMVEALGRSGSISMDDIMACFIVPTVEHHIELGTPSWIARFQAQAIVDPALRDLTIRTILRMPSTVKLRELGCVHWPNRSRELLDVRDQMIRHLTVHTFAELERDLAQAHVDQAGTETAWRTTGGQLLRAISGLNRALLDDAVTTGSATPDSTATRRLSS